MSHAFSNNNRQKSARFCGKLKRVHQENHGSLYDVDFPPLQRHATTHQNFDLSVTGTEAGQVCQAARGDNDWRAAKEYRPFSKPGDVLAASGADTQKLPDSASVSTQVATPTRCPDGENPPSLSASVSRSLSSVLIPEYWSDAIDEEDTWMPRGRETLQHSGSATFSGREGRGDALGAQEQKTRTGAELHRWGLCKPCAFIHKARGCNLGPKCDFCHLCDFQMMRQKKVRNRKQ